MQQLTATPETVVSEDVTDRDPLSPIKLGDQPIAEAIHPEETVCLMLDVPASRADALAKAGPLLAEISSLVEMWGAWNWGPNASIDVKAEWAELAAGLEGLIEAAGSDPVELPVGPPPLLGLQSTDDPGVHLVVDRYNNCLARIVSLSGHTSWMAKTLLDNANGRRTPNTWGISRTLGCHEHRILNERGFAIAVIITSDKRMVHRLVYGPEYVDAEELAHVA